MDRVKHILIGPLTEVKKGKNLLETANCHIDYTSKEAKCNPYTSNPTKVKSQFLDYIFKAFCCLLIYSCSAHDHLLPSYHELFQIILGF